MGKWGRIWRWLTWIPGAFAAYFNFRTVLGILGWIVDLPGYLDSIGTWKEEWVPEMIGADSANAVVVNLGLGVGFLVLTLFLLHRFKCWSLPRVISYIQDKAQTYEDREEERILWRLEEAARRRLLSVEARPRRNQSYILLRPVDFDRLAFKVDAVTDGYLLSDAGAGSLHGEEYYSPRFLRREIKVLFRKKGVPPATEKDRDNDESPVEEI